MRIESIGTRPKWDPYYLNIALAVAARGECTRNRVGAVIVRRHTILSTGYNGAPPGAVSCLEGGCPRGLKSLEEIPSGSGYAETGCTVIHAEANAIIRAGRERCSGATIYVTAQPCPGCTALILASGLERVVWLGDDEHDVIVRNSEDLRILPS